MPKLDLWLEQRRCEADMDQQLSAQHRQHVAARAALQRELQQISQVRQMLEDEKEEQGDSANSLVNQQTHLLVLHEECLRRQGEREQRRANIIAEHERRKRERRNQRRNINWVNDFGGENVVLHASISDAILEESLPYMEYLYLFH
jgi:hypothetical protein